MPGAIEYGRRALCGLVLMAGIAVCLWQISNKQDPESPLTADLQAQRVLPSLRPPQRALHLSGRDKAHDHESSERAGCDDVVGMSESFHSAVPEHVYLPVAANTSLLAAMEGDWKEFLNSVPSYESVGALKGEGRGVLYCAGASSFHQLMLSVHMLRYVGCSLPVEVWQFEGELSEQQVAQVSAFNATVRTVTPHSFRSVGKHHLPNNYIIKPTALLNSAFKEILLIDTDNVALRDPTYLFATPEYISTGAMFWGDFWKTDPRNPIYQALGVPCYDEREFESGQLLVDKAQAWTALNLAWFFNRHQAFANLLYGDKDSFRFACKASHTPYHFVKYNIAQVGFMTEQETRFCGHTMAQFDTNGQVLFLHWNAIKYGNWHDDQNGFKVARPWTYVQWLHDPEGHVVRAHWIDAADDMRCIELMDKRRGLTIPPEPLQDIEAFYKGYASVQRYLLPT